MIPCACAPACRGLREPGSAQALCSLEHLTVEVRPAEPLGVRLWRDWIKPKDFKTGAVRGQVSPHPLKKHFTALTSEMVAKEQRTSIEAVMDLTKLPFHTSRQLLQASDLVLPVSDLMRLVGDLTHPTNSSVRPTSDLVRPFDLIRLAANALELREARRALLRRPRRAPLQGRGG